MDFKSAPAVWPTIDDIAATRVQPPEFVASEKARRRCRSLLKLCLQILVYVIGLLASGLPSTADAKVLIHVDLDAQEMSVTANGGQTHVWKVSSGRDGFETPTGVFQVQRLDAHHFSDEYDQAPMPYSIFFSEGIAIHGTYERGLGRPASHGCIRLSLPHARMLYSLVEKFGATIEVSGMAPPADEVDLVQGRRQVIHENSGHSSRPPIEVFPPD
jgi:lipoprotein-anchoring transpeptidase ErfK/SrfK